MSPRNIALIAVACALLVPWIIEWIRVIGLQAQEKASEKNVCKVFRYLVWVIGQVRSGKTTFLAGYANVRTIDLIKKAHKKVEFCCRAFPTVPFDCIEGILEADAGAGLIDAYTEARKLVASGNILSRYSNLTYDNHTSAKPTPFLDILASYIDATWALLRNNFVFYYAKSFWSRVTKNYAMDYDPKMLGIKDCFRNETGTDAKTDKGPLFDYHILPFSVIVEDERQISGKDCLRFMNYSKEDSGASDCMRLIGQLGQETIYYITDNQSWGTDINRERNLATEVLLLNDSVAVNPRFMEMFLLRMAEVPARIHMWFLGKKASRLGMVSPYLFQSWPRTYLSKTADLKKRITAKSGYVIYHGLVYHNPSDFGKKSKQAIFKTESLRAVFPLLYCYGSIDTFQFHSVQQKLIEHSRWRMTDEAKPADPEELADAVLSKRSKAKKEAKTDVKA